MIDTDTSASPAPDAGEIRSAPIRLWLVDDNDRLRHTLAELLGREPGIECTRSFSSATAALSALASKSGPDVILLDVQMGPENGLDAVRPIKSLSRHTRVFMFTTLEDGQARARALEEGASGFLLKRYPIGEIVDSIRRPACAEKHPVVRRKRPINPPVANCADAPELMPAKSGTDSTLARPMRKLSRWYGALKNLVNVF